MTFSWDVFVIVWIFCGILIVTVAIIGLIVAIIGLIGLAFKRHWAAGIASLMVAVLFVATIAGTVAGL